MSTSIEAKLSSAGAIVMADPHSEKAVPYVARGYTHAALAGRAVVRLLPQALAEAEDLALSTMGLVGSTTAEVGFGQRVALGFPAWPLIHDPGNARHALALVKDLERTARKAKTKPGAAKDEIDLLATRLGSSAPHFLPTFMEEVGRIYARLDNKAMAGQFFGKARTAERVHNLVIDEDRHREVFLEFAFAGALTVKALTEEAKELPGRVSAPEAYRLFRQLSLERVKGGLPPYAGMAKDLRAMAKAASLDAATEDAAVVAELLVAPSTKRAVQGFWTAYAKAIAAAAQADPGLQTTLLALFPSEADSATWVSILRAAGAVDRAKDGAVDLAAWLGRLLDHHHASSWRYPEASPSLETLLHELAPLLTSAAVQQPASLSLATWRDLDLDVLDVLAEHGITVTIEERRRTPLDVTDHLKRTGNSRTLEHLAAAPQWTAALRQTVLDSLQNQTRPHPQVKRPVTTEERITALAAYPGLLSTLRAMVSAAVETADGSLNSLGQSLNLLEALSSPTALTLVGDLVTQLPDPNVAAQLADVYNAGLLDELGWDAYEDVLAGYREPGKNNGPSVDHAWPHALVYNTKRATVVSRDGVLLEHTVRLFKEYPQGKYSRPSFLFIGGDLLVYWSADGTAGEVGYWASNPHEIFPVSSEWLPSWADSLPTGPTSATLGHRNFQAGERAKPKSRTDGLAGDGSHIWITDGGRTAAGKADPTVLWHELDLATGALGRRSVPAFLADIAARRGHSVAIGNSSLRPAGPEFRDNPLGWQAGTIGQCWYTDAAGVTWLERADGVRAGNFPDPADVGRHDSLVSRSSQLLSLPGGGLLLAAPQYLANAHTATIVGTTLDSGRIRFAAGTPSLVPPKLRHNLRVRHEATSLRLRTVTAAQLAALVAVIETPPRHGDGTVAAFTAAELAAFAAVFPDCPDSLRAGILGVVYGAKRDATIAAWLREQAGEVLARDSSAAGSAEVQDLDAISRLFQAVPAAFGTLTSNRYGNRNYYNRVEPTLKSMIGNIVAVSSRLAPAPAAPPVAPPPEPQKSGGFFKKLLNLAGPAAAPPAAAAPEPPVYPWVEDDGAWSDLLQSPSVLIALALSAQTSADDRERLAWILQSLAESGLVDRAADISSVRVSADSKRKLSPGQVLRSDGGQVVLLAEAAQNYPIDEATAHFAAIAQGAPDYTALGLDVLWRVPAESGQRTAADLERAAALLRAEPRIAPSGDVQALVAATGMLPEEATFYLAGIPAPASSWHPLDPELVKRLGLTAGGAKLARDTFKACSTAQLRLLLGALVPDTLSAPLQLGADTAKLAAAWTAQFGATGGLEPEVLRAGFTELKELSHPVALLRWAMAPVESTAVPAWKLLDHLQACLWLAYSLPAEHPGRPGLPEKILVLRASIATRTHSINVGRDTSNAFRTSHGLPDKPRGAASRRQENPPLGRDLVGPFIVHYDFHRPYEDSAYDVISVDGALFTAADLPLLATISTDSDHSANIRMLQTLFGPAMDAFVAALRTESRALSGPLPSPLVSASGTVAEVAAALGLSEDAAVLFLQLLALPDPTNAKVQKFNGWTPARRTKAGAELEAAGLVVRAKRARAGRELFLDGGWVTLRGSSLPLEAWKTALYGLPPGDKPQLAMELLLLHETLPQLFARAWARYTGGDKPAYEQLTTGR